MKKMIAIILTVLIVLTLPTGIFGAAGETFQTEEQLIEYLQNQKADGLVTVEFTVSRDLYKELSADKFKECCRMLYKAGIDGRGSGIYSSDKDYALKLSVRYSDDKAYDCSTSADLEEAFADMVKENCKSANILCSPSLYKTVTNNKNSAFYFPASKYGIQLIYDRPLDDLEIIEISEMRFIDGTYAYAEDYSQFAAAVSQFEKQKLDEFNVVFSYDTFNKVMKDKSEWKTMIASSTINECIVINRGSGGTVNFSGVSYTDIARAICRSTGELAGIISQMGAAGITEFEIFFPYKEVFEELKENDFAKLHEIEAEAGMSSGKMSYSMYGDRISYEDARIVSDAVALKSLSDAISYTEKAVTSGESEINLFCTEKLYDELLGDLTNQFVIIPDGLTRIYDLLSQTGICDYEMSSFPSTHVINISIKKLFPGTAIMLAEKSGDDSSLSDREKKTREEARKIAKEANNKDPLLTAKYIHDWLCEKNVYTDDETTDEDDTAIGAILNGEANCDGYTDAFYLIGSLAGLNVRYQHGDSYEKGFNFAITPITHIWNLLEIDDEWRMVDVTWDDNGDSPTYVWFNVGQDVASLMHIWNEDMTVALAPVTERTFCADNECYAKESSEVNQFLQKMNSERPAELVIVAPEIKKNDLLQLVRDGLAASNMAYAYNDKMGMLTVAELEW